MKDRTSYSKLINRFKNNKSIPLVLMMVAVVLAIGSFVDALNNIDSLFKENGSINKVELVGKVFELDTGEPIQNAQLVFENDTISVMTDSLGHFKVLTSAISRNKELSFYVIKDGYDGVYRSKTAYGESSSIILNIGLRKK